MTKQLSPDEFLRIEIEAGISADNPDFIRLAEATEQMITRLDLPIISVLDYGAGTGVYADAFQRARYDVKAYDIWEPHRTYITQKFPNVVLVDKPVTTDLMLFIEVAEHMTDKEIRALFRKMRPSYILFSSTPFTTANDEAWGHINVKHTGQWLGLFDQLGYELERADVMMPTAWAIVLKLKA
jgi:2-polyprenyl-3-methyl-5-hydroxy-6-metoxy-1,4-benzoquinol methylase